MKNVIVAPSLLAADPLRFGEEIEDVEKGGADWHHVDVMDGHFVPNLTYGLPFVKALKKASDKILDVHIMVANPDQVAVDYVKAGADILVFPVESAIHHHRLIQAIQQAGARAGVAVNPGTSVDKVKPLLPYLDLVNMMSVNPGFGGQSFIGETVERISELHEEIQRIGRGNDIVIEVDGGINDETGAAVVKAGATALVAGTYVYGAQDRAEVIGKLKALGA